MLAAIGDITVDAITQPRDLIKIELEQTTDINFRIGGQTANFARFSSRLGTKTVLFGRVGKDFPGNWILKELKKQNVQCKVKQGKKTAITIALVQQGKRAFLNDPGENNLLSKKDINMTTLKKAEHVHIGGFWFMEKLWKDLPSILKKTKSNSLSIGWDPKGWTPQRKRALWKTLENVDTLLLNERELLELTGIKHFEKASKSIPCDLLMHRGSKGCYLKMPGISLRTPAKKIKTRNPVGSGDALDAAFIYWRMKGATPEKSVKKATDFAAKHLLSST
ncbi:carbohydrate kinase family protein [archaeon]|nr:carbohydrate kinase family protein [archaeon]